jgi:hypothetical protein
VRSVHRQWLTYVSCSEGEHGEEDDGQLGFRHLGTDSSQDSHDCSGLGNKTKNHFKPS